MRTHNSHTEEYVHSHTEQYIAEARSHRGAADILGKLYGKKVGGKVRVGTAVEKGSERIFRNPFQKTLVRIIS